MRARDIDKENLVKKTAIEIIGKGGFEHFSINKLAKACGISVATLYIYYKDKEDLLSSLATELGRKMGDAMLKDFDPESSFEAGLRQQWLNRYHYMIENQSISLFFEQVRTSSYQEQFLKAFAEDLKNVFGKFMDNIVARGEINAMPLEVYWSVAFAPLYALIKFNNEGQSLGGKPFKLTDEMFWQAFDLVVKALKR
ncbi:TetR/AcrR family transcriptional regulator [Pedobacter sp.]|jgi:TetR/AcrR family transcriptional repressor of multidrug resistance operon|uniref:TetR/AcrR family transcriptional regulator n=1 Tax=Pedobacter sp. TaxID=1411316 RepID=UPI00105C3E31|nr:TetR/AcrR family transcriptional regulator [Pedobacter sp.]HWW42873.1 TetR/AcrR family transcriptional regulator [Pedobacter sp.]